ncbi:MAG TPA: amidohydrolase, partial [Acidobacteriota bacterium]|nr:amidohydrolase [Acidobacteriota bacterium]
MNFRSRFQVLILIPSLLGLWMLSPQGRVEPADWIMEGGLVYTMDAARSSAEALAIRDGMIAYVGSGGGAERFRGPETRRLSLEGKMALPGFHDAHVHPATGGLRQVQCILDGLETAAAVLEAIETYARTNPDEEWILGGGWDLPLFPQANPRKETLDRLVPDRPVYLRAADGHSAWVNSRALQMAGVDASSPDPPNGRIERDADSGEPTGTLRESAMYLVADVIPPPSIQDYQDGIARSLDMANRFGITSMQDAAASPDILRAYDRLRREGRLTARVVAAQSVSPEGGVAQFDEMEEGRRRFQSERLRATAAKIFVDGVIEAQTAALLEPYLHHGDWRGEPNLSPEMLNLFTKELSDRGFQIHFHAIGDRAVRMSLNAVEVSWQAGGKGNLRHHVSHLQLIDPADIPRFMDLGVIANFQPLWAYPDNYIEELTVPFLGPERSRWLYPIRSVFAAGAVVVAGSDWSVSSMNPLDAIEVAVTRQSPRIEGGDILFQEERV